MKRSIKKDLKRIANKGTPRMNILLKKESHKNNIPLPYVGNQLKEAKDEPTNMVARAKR